AEAMLHGAIPVVARRFSLPEVAGDVGLYGDPDEPRTFVRCLRDALNAGHDAATAARSRVVREFSLNKRRAALLALLDAICHASPDERSRVAEPCNVSSGSE